MASVTRRLFFILPNHGLKSFYLAVRQKVGRSPAYILAEDQTKRKRRNWEVLFDRTAQI
tara:strand:- start:57 stop:233 length:177 start_codon:yes stop_codon:yes gene_type:complete